MLYVLYVCMYAAVCVLHQKKQKKLQFLYFIGSKLASCPSRGRAAPMLRSLRSFASFVQQTKTQLANSTSLSIGCSSLRPSPIADKTTIILYKWCCVSTFGVCAFWVGHREVGKWLLGVASRALKSVIAFFCQRHAGYQIKRELGDFSGRRSQSLSHRSLSSFNVLRLRVRQIVSNCFTCGCVKTAAIHLRLVLCHFTLDNSLFSPPSTNVCTDQSR